MVQKTVENDQGSGLKSYAIEGAKMAALPPGSIFGLSGMVRRHRSIANVIRDAVRIPAPIPEEDRKSFQWWVDYFELSSADLQDRENEILLESRICYTFAVLASILSLTFAFDGNAMATIAGFAGAWICGVAGFCRNFRAFQIRRRELCDFSVYLRSPEGWIA